jgi:hypothetical protein
MAASLPAPAAPPHGAVHEFDVFLSHKFVGGSHAPTTLAIFDALTAAGLRVWLDKVDMGHDLNHSMQHGIEKSGCVVALMTRRYGTDADARARCAAWDAAPDARVGDRPGAWVAEDDNCVKELAWAKAKGKAVIACLVDEDAKWFPSDESHIVKSKLVEPKTHMMLNFTANAGAATENLLKYVRGATSVGIRNGCYAIVPALRHGGLHGIKGFCFDVKDDHALHTSNDAIIIWSRKDGARADAANQLFYVENDGDCVLLRAKCCYDARGAAYVGAGEDGKLVVTDAPFRWRVARVSDAFTLSPGDDASRRVEVSWVVTVFGAQPRLARAEEGRKVELRQLFHFVEV